MLELKNITYQVETDGADKEIIKDLKEKGYEGTLVHPQNYNKKGFNNLINIFIHR